MSGSTTCQPLGELNFQESGSPRVIEVNRVTIRHPDGFQPDAARAPQTKMQAAISAVADQRGRSQTELILKDVFPLAQRLMDKSPQFIQTADGVEAVEHGVIRPEAENLKR